ncbi:hypothetical protein SAMN04244572_02007 [Azotobacter beijerinckii]|uniref:Uncharacterized protein n=1 Tax=Azotobacter beijerinckii TaxID=170623 RepID=A0A1H6UHX8_9GAMM|nr:hypothetical protein SAMN04244572_02007 [Azotobacter beijerinckii]
MPRPSFARATPIALPDGARPCILCLPAPGHAPARPSARA